MLPEAGEVVQRRVERVRMTERSAVRPTFKAQWRFEAAVFRASLNLSASLMPHDVRFQDP